MRYDEAIAVLNGTDCYEIKEKLGRLKNRNHLEENEEYALLEQTVGILFSVCKECKDEELYRIEKRREKQAENEAVLWKDDRELFGAEYLEFVANPVTPFTENPLECGDELLLLTYRKAVSENPKLVLLEGVEEGSTVFGILEREGLSEAGKENYLSICGFIKDEADKEIRNHKLLSKIAELLCRDSGAAGFCYNAGGAQHSVFWKAEAKIYFRCTSSIVCSLVSIEENDGETEVKIKPIAHNANKIEKNSPIEYEEFGEVGCFTFEMADYN